MVTILKYHMNDAKQILLNHKYNNLTYDENILKSGVENYDEIRRNIGGELSVDDFLSYLIQFTSRNRIMEFSDEKISKLLEILNENSFIRELNDLFEITPFSLLGIDLYQSPDDLWCDMHIEFNPSSNSSENMILQSERDSGLFNLDNIELLKKEIIIICQGKISKMLKFRIDELEQELENLQCEEY